MKVGALARKDRLILLGTGWLGKTLPWLGFLWLALGVVASIFLLVNGQGPQGAWPSLGEFSQDLYQVVGAGQLFLILALVPLVAVESTLLDLEEDRLQLLALTPIPSAGFVFDKVRVAMTAPATFLFVTSWSLVPCIAAGGVPLGAAAWMIASLGVESALVASLAVLFAAAARQALVARLATFLGIGIATLVGGSSTSSLNPLRSLLRHFLWPSESLTTWPERWTWLGMALAATLVAAALAAIIVGRLLRDAAAGTWERRFPYAQALLAVVAGAGVVDLLVRGEAGAPTAIVFCAAIAWGALGPVLAARRARRAVLAGDPVAWKDRQLYRAGNLQVVLGAMFLGNLALCAWWTTRGASLRTPGGHVGYFLQIELCLLSAAALVLGATAFAWERLRGTFDLVLLSGLRMDRIARSKVRAVLLGLLPIWLFSLAWALAACMESAGSADAPSALGTLVGGALGLIPLGFAAWLGCAYGLAARTMGEVAGSFGGSVWVFYQVGRWLLPFRAPNAFTQVISPFWFPGSFAEGEPWTLWRIGSFLGWLVIWGFLVWVTPRAVQASARRLDPWGEMVKAQKS